MSYKFSKSILIALLLILASTAVVAAQASGPQTRPSRPDPLQRETQRQFEMQIIEKALNEERPTRVQRYTPLVLEQIKSDFLGIQVIDRKLSRATSASGSLDFDFVRSSAKEIGKLSKRLKKNLALPTPATSSDRLPIVVDANEESLRQAVPVLSKLIDHLVSNPMFEHSKLIDAELSAQAFSDLDEIIRFSSEVRRSTEKLLSQPKARL
jgi:hypothetical protein